jgi:protein-disulfide isomerase
MSKKRRRRKRSGEKKAPGAGGAPASSERDAPNRLGVVVAVVGLAALAVAVALVGQRDPAPPSAPEAASEPAAGASALERWQQAPARDLGADAGSFSRGPADAPVTIVEFSDFECPFCRQASRALAEVERQYEGKLRLVFRDFPLDASCNGYLSQQMHPLACRAARLARCAGAQDAFWPAHDALFALDALTEAELDALPARLSLDEEALTVCMASDETAARVREDIDAGRELDVTGTPALFVNGREAPDYAVDDLRSIVDHILSSP